MEHVILCKEEGAVELWTKEMKELKKWMKTQDIHDEIATIILTYLYSWQNKKGNEYDPHEIILRQALADQKRIG